MKRIIWLWKHRHSWEQLKYLYEIRCSLKVILRESYLEESNDILEHIREFDQVPLARPWKVTPPILMRGTELPARKEGESNPFLERLDPAKCKERVPLLNGVPPRPRRN